MNITELQAELRNIEIHEAAQAITSLAQKWDGVELHYSLKATANKLSVPLDIAQAGLRMAVKSGTLTYASIAGSEETLLIVK